MNKFFICLAMLFSFLMFSETALCNDTSPIKIKAKPANDGGTPYCYYSTTRNLKFTVERHPDVEFIFKELWLGDLMVPIDEVIIRPSESNTLLGSSSVVEEMTVYLTVSMSELTSSSSVTFDIKYECHGDCPDELGFSGEPDDYRNLQVDYISCTLLIPIKNRESVGQPVDFTLNPNPVTDVAYLNVKNSTSQISLDIVNGGGEIIEQRTLALKDGNELLEIDMINFPKGLYLVRVKLANTLWTEKFIKL